MSVNSYMADQRINWIFNSPNSPWMGGVWERLVQSVKRAYNKMVGRRKLSLIEMQTVVTMIEAILNTRPITHINPADKLSFSLFVEDSENYYDPDYNYHAINTVNQANEVLQNINRLVEKFWNDWKTTYLTELRNSHKIRFRQGRHGRRHLPLIGEVVLVMYISNLPCVSNPAVYVRAARGGVKGEMRVTEYLYILIEHELSPRRMWHYGLVIEPVKSSDREIRSVKLRGPNGRTLHRPINKLYPMEIQATSPFGIVTTTNMHGDLNLDQEDEEIIDNDFPTLMAAKYLRHPPSIRLNDVFHELRHQFEGRRCCLLPSIN
uniref:DUF5641 domain-containing protein n=1 Tax=Heterorhabditis bacteriophora TaxID=37862 RepID=A0A1I7WW62_HETBA